MLNFCNCSRTVPIRSTTGPTIVQHAKNATRNRARSSRATLLSIWLVHPSTDGNLKRMTNGQTVNCFCYMFPNRAASLCFEGLPRGWSDPTPGSVKRKPSGMYRWLREDEAQPAATVSSSGLKPAAQACVREQRSPSWYLAFLVYWDLTLEHHSLELMESSM